MTIHHGGRGPGHLSRWSKAAGSSTALAGVGDSITLGLNSAEKFLDIVGYAIPALSVSNYGVSGSSWGYDWAGDPHVGTLTDDVPTQAGYLANSASRHVMIAFAGTNGIVLKGNTGAQEYSEFETWLAAMITAGQNVTDLYVATMIPRSVGDETARGNYNSALVAGAATHGYHMIRFDLDPVMSKLAPSASVSFTDGIHPTTFGHRLLAPIAYEAITGSTFARSNGWCEVDDSASGFTFASTNRRVTRTASGWKSNRAEVARYTGKRVFEVKAIGSAAGGNYMVGLMGAAGTCGVYLGGAYESIGFWASGILTTAPFTVVNASHKPTGTITDGLTHQIAVDFDAGKVHFGIDGTYFGDPAAGTSPAATFTANTVLFPGITMNDIDCGTWELNLAPSSLPSGFSAWLP